MTTRPTVQERGLFKLVDSIRGIAALSVVLAHVAYYWPVSGSQFMRYVTQRNSGPPAISVVVFFVISGFGMYRGFAIARFDGKPLPRVLPFAIRRATRLIPAYWVALTVTAIVEHLNYVFTPTGFIRYFCFLQLYEPHAQASGGISVAWTLCVEVTFYISLPVLALAARRLGRRYSLLRSEFTLFAAMILTTLIFETVVCLAIPDDSQWKLSVLAWLPGCLDFFAAGMALAVLSVDIERRERLPGWWKVVNHAWVPWLIGFALMGIAGQISGTVGYTTWWLTTHELKVLAAFFLLLPAIFGEPGRGLIRKFLSLRVLMFYGTISYGVYLWHYQALYKFQSDLLPHGEAYTTIVLMVIATFAGTVSWYLIERPSQRFVRRWLARRGGGVPATTTLVATGAVVPPDSRP